MLARQLLPLLTKANVYRNFFAQEIHITTDIESDYVGISEIYE